MNRSVVYIALSCFIGLCSCAKHAAEEITFTEHIAPIIFEHCTSCHHQEGTAPFSLSTYKEVFRKKKTILRVTRSGYMPPWPADPNYSHFVGENVLNETEKQRIADWIAQGAPEGPAHALPDLPLLNRYSQLGNPDLTLWLDSLYIEGNNEDHFFVVKLPFELTSDTNIRAIEFVPGNKQLVHHMNGHLLMYEPGAKKNVFSGNRVIRLNDPDYVAAFNSLELYNDDGSQPERIHSAVNYLPGVRGTMYPEGIGGYRLRKTVSFVANDIHYGPQPKGVWDRSHINLFFSEHPPERPTFETMMGTNGVTPIVPPLVIPPGEVKTFKTEAIIPEDISILTINPHMHLLGKSFLAYGISPTGDTIRLIRIPEWDFRWQYFYTFSQMLKIPRGTKLVVEATFDNTANNPNNPYKPPRTIGERLEYGGSSMRTTDEMLQFIITWMPYQNGDEHRSLRPENQK